MSRHSVQARYQGREVLVVAGYDRPLDDVFLQVFDTHAPGPDGGDTVIYCSINEPQLDWRDVDTIASKLASLGIEVPSTMLECVYLDQLLRVGNRVEHHTWSSQANGARPAP